MFARRALVGCSPLPCSVTARILFFSNLASAPAAGCALASAASSAQWQPRRAFSAAAAQVSAPAAAQAAGSAAPALAAAGAAALSAPPPPGVSTRVIELHAVRRELDGKRHAQYSRRHGLIPGLVYSAASSKGGFVSGQQGTLKVYVKEADLRREVNRARTSFLNTLVTLVVDGVRHTVLPRDLQLHPFRPKIICCNWYKYTPGKFPGTKVDIPLVAANEERCLAFKEGGWLLQLVHKLPLYAFGDAIPENLVMDLRGKRMGEKIMASDINLGGFLSLRFRDQDFAVAKFVGSGKKGATPGAAAEAAPKKAEAAAGGDKAKAPAAAAATK